MSTYSAEWTDLSDHVVHFTKDFNGADAYANILSILYSGRIEARSPFGIGRKLAPPGAPKQNACCFSEVPLHLLSRLAHRRSQYGVVFKKSLILLNGGGPIWYVEENTPQHAGVRALMHRGFGVAPPGDPIWTLTPMIDVMGDFSTGSYRFEWEREWRLRPDLRFKVDDAACLIIPERLHAAARAFFDGHGDNSTGPCYRCPFIDPYWDIARVHAALAT